MRTRLATPAACLAIALSTALLLGCSATGTPAPSATPPPSPGLPSATPDLTLIPTDPGTTPAATQPGQTDTEWGRIWDALPEGFPAYPGSHPTETGEGPMSALLDAGSAAPAAVANFYATALEAAGYTTTALSGPREDGSWELESGAGGGCLARVTATPLGSATIVAILFGAGCPFG